MTQTALEWGYEYPKLLFCRIQQGDHCISLGEDQLRNLHAQIGDRLLRKEKDLFDHIKKKMGMPPLNVSVAAREALKP